MYKSLLGGTEFEQRRANAVDEPGVSFPGLVSSIDGFLDKGNARSPYVVLPV